MDGNKNDEYIGLGGVRGIAIVYVSLLYRWVWLCAWPFHFQHGNEIALRLVWDGYLMVEVFFFLSGYFSYIKYSESIRIQQISFTEYILGKVIKFFPLLILTAISATIVQIVGYFLIKDTGFSNVISVSGLLLSCLGLQSGYYNDGGIYSNPTEWYICILLLCYTLFYGICRVKNTTIRTLTLLIWSLLGSAIMLAPRNWFLAYESNGRGYFAFGVGCLFAILYHKRGTKNKTKRCVLSIIVLMTIMIIYIFRPDYIGNKNIVICILLCPALFTVSVECKWIKKLLSSRPLVALGKMSYSIYLWSFPIDIFIYILLVYVNRRDLLSNIMIWLISCIVILIVSCISKYYIEKRLQRLFRRVLNIFE